MIIYHRDRPVQVCATRFGAELRAVQRGYFPVSVTGYRSVPGVRRPEELAAGYLEALAVLADRQWAATLAEPWPQAGPDPLANFFAATFQAGVALDAGFFAPEDLRSSLWQRAMALWELVERDGRFRPRPEADRWTAENCADELARQRAIRDWLELAAAGRLDAAPARPGLAAACYGALPPRIEPVVMLRPPVLV